MLCDQVGIQSLKQFALYNFTDSTSIIWGFASSGTTENLQQSFIGSCDLIQGKSYGIDLSVFGGNTNSFSLFIEEIVPVSSNQFTFDDPINVRTLNVVNSNVGQSGLIIKNQNVSWRMRTDASGNLIFE